MSLGTHSGGLCSEPQKVRIPAMWHHDLCDLQEYNSLLFSVSPFSFTMSPSCRYSITVGGTYRGTYHK